MAELAAYNFDEDTGPVLDCTGNGFDFTLSASSARVAGRFDTALGKTASGGMSALPAGLLAASQTASRAVMFHGRGSGTTWWVRWHVGSIDSGGWGILSLDGVSIGVQGRNASTFARALTPIPDTTNWHHYCATYDGTTLRFYVDGALAASSALAGPLRTDATTLDIAEWGAGPGTDNLRILTHVPTDAEIAAYAAQNVTAAPAASTGDLDATAPAAAAAVAAVTQASGGLAAVAPAPVAAVTVKTLSAGDLAASAPAAVASLDGALGPVPASGDLQISAPAARAAFDGGTTPASGTLTATAPAARASLRSGDAAGLGLRGGPLQADWAAGPIRGDWRSGPILGEDT